MSCNDLRGNAGSFTLSSAGWVYDPDCLERWGFLAKTILVLERLKGAGTLSKFYVQAFTHLNQCMTIAGQVQFKHKAFWLTSTCSICCNLVIIKEDSHLVFVLLLLSRHSPAAVTDGGAS